jgi:hypothetical protein
MAALSTAVLTACGDGTESNPTQTSVGPSITPLLTVAPEPTISVTSPDRSALAALYQPVLVVAQGDRFWPIPVPTLLRLRNGSTGTCLQTQRDCPNLTSLDQLSPGASPHEYLRYPERKFDQQAQFVSFARAIGISEGTIADWSHGTLADPQATAQEYFFYAARPPPWSPPLPTNLVTLQYWFFYGFNYWPGKIDNPIQLDFDPDHAAGDFKDLHEGDWEHVDIIVDPASERPAYVLMGRHGGEDALFDWNSPALAKQDGTHVVVYSGFGGHASYNTCGTQKRSPTRAISRAIVGTVLYDYTVCPNPPVQNSLPPAPPGPVFTFPATTRMVELRRDSWACWPGEFGDNPLSVRVIDFLRRRLSALGALELLLNRIGGPDAPLRQSENKGECGP